MGSYPGTTSTLGGVLTVRDNGGSLTISGTLTGLEPSVTGGWHVHTGKTCSNASEVYGHYYTTAPDPWTPVKYTSDAAGTASVELTIAGFSLTQALPVLDRAVVVHASSGARVGCGLIQPTTQMCWQQKTYETCEGSWMPDAAMGGVAKVCSFYHTAPKSAQCQMELPAGRAMLMCGGLPAGTMPIGALTNKMSDAWCAKKAAKKCKNPKFAKNKCAKTCAITAPSAPPTPPAVPPAPPLAPINASLVSPPPPPPPMPSPPSCVDTAKNARVCRNKKRKNKCHKSFVLQMCMKTCSPSCGATAAKSWTGSWGR